MANPAKVARGIDERVRRDPTAAQVQPYIDRLKRGERNHWLAYTVAKLLWQSGLWDGLTRAGMRRMLGKALAGVDCDTVAMGWTEFFLAHKSRLPE